MVKSFSLINESLVNGFLTLNGMVAAVYCKKKNYILKAIFAKKVFSFNQFAIMIALIIKQKVAFPNLTE